MPGPTASDHTTAIASLLAARSGGPLFKPDYELQSISDAYAIHDGLMTTLGPVGGWKVARWGVGESLIYAPIRAAAIKPSLSTWQPAECAMRALELEIAFRINSPLPSAYDHDFIRKLAGAVTPLPVFEIVDSRLAEQKAASRLWRLADFQINAGLVHGPALQTIWQPEDFDRPTVQLQAGDKDVFEPGPATLNAGTPFGLLADLVRECRHCGGVQPGQIVTTGSFKGLHRFPVGTTVTGTITGMAPVTTTFTA